MQYFLKSVVIALHNIRANPLHTFLSTLGIIIGVASLVAILALGDGLEQTGREQLANTTSLNIITVSSNAYKTVDDIRVRVENRPEISTEHAFEAEEVFHQKAFIELTDRRTTQIQKDDSVSAVYLQGIMHQTKEFVNDSLRHGRFISAQDVKDEKRVAVVSNIITEKLGLKTDEAIGESFTLKGEDFEIVGIFDVKENDLPFVYIPISVYRSQESSFPTLTLKALLAEEIPAIEKEIEEWLDEEFEQGSDAFSVTSNRARVEQFSRGILLFKLIMGAITGISVLVGGIGVMNVLLISVTERTKEIGIRKATGAKKKDIILQFMSESITISLVGSSLGWLLGIIGVTIFVPIVNNMSGAGFSAAVRIETAFLIFILATVIGVVFGTYPAWRASQLDPIDAIRHE
ncbi:MAG: ABC transporter permease [Balneolales bacterium]|nr:ABC transporter permease [Balneolales bacterium]